MRDLNCSRPNLVRLDANALAKNLTIVRGLVPDGTEIYQVCKGDGYGLGVVQAARLGVDAGLRTFCVGTPEEAMTLRAAMPDIAVMLFPGAQAEDFPALAAQGIVLTVHSDATLRKVLEEIPSAPFEIKVNTGLYRYGFDKTGWLEVLDRISLSKHGGLRGIYSHISQSQDGQSVSRAVADFQWFISTASERLGRPLPGMLAASPTVMKQPELPFGRIDPGRALYGMLSEDEAKGLRLHPIVRSVSSRLIDSHVLDEGSNATVGYGRYGQGEINRVGVIPIGHYDGLPLNGSLGTVLIRGREVPVVSRTLLASLLDLSNVPDAEVGDEVVLIGKSGTRERNIFEFSASLGLSVTALHFGLIRNLPKQFLNQI